MLTLIMEVKDGRLAPSDAQKDVVCAFLTQLGDQASVTFAKPRKQRSTKQNSYYWGVVLTMLSKETGHTTEELHEFFKARFLPRRFAVVGEVEQEVPKSTAEVTTFEFEQYLEQIRAFAAQELRMGIPLPNELFA